MADNALTRDDVRDLIREIRTTAGAPSSATVPTGMYDTLKQFGANVAPAAVGLLQLKTGTDGVATAFQAASSVIGTFAPSLGKGVDAIGKVIVDSKAALDEAGKIGVGMNSIGRLAREAGDAGLSMKQFTDLIKTTNGGLGGLGSNAGKSADEFSKLMVSVNASGEELYKLGYSTQEVAEISAMSLKNSTRVNLSNQDAMLKAGEAAKALAIQIDETSRITGMSRDAIKQTMQAEEERPETIIEMIRLTQDQQNGLRSVRESMSGFGDGVVNLTTRMGTSGVIDAKAQATINALGADAANKIKEATIASKNATTPEEKARAKELQMQAEAAIYQRMASEQFANMVRAQVPEAMELVQKTKGLQSAMAAAQAANGDYVQGVKNQHAEVGRIQQGQKADLDKNGKPVVDKDQETARLLGEANRNVAIQAGGVARNLETMNTSIGSSAQSMKQLRDAIEFVTGKGTSSAAAAKKNEATVKDVSDAIDKAKPNFKPGPSGYQPGQKIEPAGGREFGSLGTVGKLIEDFGAGTPMMLHGREGVVTESQMTSLMSGMISSTTNIGKAMSKSMPNPATTAPAEMFQQATKSFGGNDDAMKEMIGQLDMLNKSMSQLISHSALTAENTHNQVRATKSLSGDRLSA